MILKCTHDIVTIFLLCYNKPKVGFQQCCQSWDSSCLLLARYINDKWPTDEKLSLVESQLPSFRDNNGFPSWVAHGHLDLFLLFLLGEFIYLKRPQQEVFKNNSEHGYQGLYTCFRCLTISFQLFYEMQWMFLAKFQLWQALFQPRRLTNNWLVVTSPQYKIWQWKVQPLIELLLFHCRLFFNVWTFFQKRQRWYVLAI